MKTMIKSGLALLTLSLFMGSCQKNDSQLATPQEHKDHEILLALEQPEITDFLVQEFRKFEDSELKKSSGASFIVPFFTSDGFGIIKDLVLDTTGPFPTIVGGELGLFSALLDDNDFYRLNPDSTISVHITSNSASAFYTNFGSGVNYDNNYNPNANLSMNYSGPVISFSPFPGLVFYFIATQQASFHGVGKVRENVATFPNPPSYQGNEKNLGCQWNITPSGKSNSHLKLN